MLALEIWLEMQLIDENPGHMLSLLIRWRLYKFLEWNFRVWNLDKARRDII